MLNVLEDSLPTTQIAPTFLPELYMRALLPEVPSSLRIMPDPLVARIILPRTTLMMPHLVLGHLPSLAEKSLFWSHCFQTMALASSTGIKYVPQFNCSHVKWKRDQLSS